MYLRGYSIKKIVDMYSRYYNPDKDKVYLFDGKATRADVLGYVVKVILNYNRSKYRSCKFESCLPQIMYYLVSHLCS